MTMPVALPVFPLGLATRTLSFGRYSSVLGTNKGGVIRIGYDKPMLHIPTGDVIIGGVDIATIPVDVGAVQVDVPITITDDLLADWRNPTAAFTNQRLHVEVDVPGYRSDVVYVDISPLDSPVIDFDQLQKYSSVGGLPISRAAVAAVAGLQGDITAQALATALQPFIESGDLTEEQITEVVNDVVVRLEPPVNLTLLFENSLA